MRQGERPGGPLNLKASRVPFSGGQEVPAAWVETTDELPQAIAHLGLSVPRPVLVLVGGAANLDPSVAGPLLGLFERLAPALDRVGAAVIDGATAYGVMALMGRARLSAAARFPLVGVAATGTVALPLVTEAAQGGTALLDPNHSHFILVPGRRWGDETPWMGACASLIAGGRSTLTLVAAGGEVTRLDVLHSLEARRPLLVIAGSGGTADQLAAWRQGAEAPAGMALGEGAKGLIQVLGLEDPGAIAAQVAGRLGT